VRIAAVLFWVVPIAFALFAVPIAIRLLQGGELPRMFGFTAFGGPFERFGTQTLAVLLIAFALVCALEALAGLWLWNGQRAGGILGLALLPIDAIFWFGFALPIPPLNALVRTALLVLNWSSLKP
jgi:hypothetical protein